MKNNQIDISLVIPAYKEEKIIEQILAHYDREILREFNAEIILSDGGSDDRTVELARPFADKIAIHTEKRRQTIAEGRNAGAALADGKAIIFINADTYPQDVRALLAYVSKWIGGELPSSKFAALATRVYVSPSDKKFSDIIFYNCFNSYVRFLNVIGMGMCRGECQIVRREIFEKIGGYNPDYAAGEDFDLFRRIAKIAHTKYVSNITVIESPRRFREQGYLRVLWQWFRNALGVMIKKEAADKEWTAIR